jgi:hypothetical protein
MRSPYAPGMQVPTSAAQVSHVDILARGLAFASLAVAIASLLLTRHLWKRSGGELTATLVGHVASRYSGHPYERVIFSVDVINTGRMVAAVRGVVVIRLTTRWGHVRWLRWWYRLTRRDWAMGNEAYPVEEGDDEVREPREIESRYPREILPTGYLKVRALMDADLIEPRHRWAQAVVFRGDNRASYSRPIPMPETSLNRRRRTVPDLDA